MAWNHNCNTFKLAVYYSDTDAKAYYSVSALKYLPTLGKLTQKVFLWNAYGAGNFKELKITRGKK